MGATECLRKATQNNFRKYFSAPGNFSALGYSLESLYGKSGSAPAVFNAF